VDSHSEPFPLAHVTRIVKKLTDIENELIALIRLKDQPKRFSAYEAHAFVRQAINALSDSIKMKPPK